MKKNINIDALSLLFKMFLLKVDRKDLFNKLPEDKTGPEYLLSEFLDDFDTAEELVNMLFEDRFNRPLPEVEIPVTPEVPVTPEEPAPTPEEKTYRISLRQDKLAGGKRFTWLGKAGKYFKSPLIVTFPECNNARMVINDPSKTFGADGNPNNHNQMFYFSGDPSQQKDTNMSCPGGCASIFAPQGCTKATYALLNQPG